MIKLPTQHHKIMITYTKEKYNNLKFKFNGSENIIRNYSQAYQDMFILTMLNGKRNGTFLEIGAFDATYANNTFLLENSFDWNGVSIDITETSKYSFSSNNRKSKFILSDALILDYNKILSNISNNSRIDYLQLDIEPQDNTFKCLKLIPFDKFKFSVITYETDVYDPAIPKEISIKLRDESRKYLESHGYVKIAGNICNVNTEDPFEDWYVDPSVIDPKIFNIFKTDKDFNNTSEKFMLNP